MRTTLVVHIFAGVLGLLFGYIALSVAKGGSVHRRTGVWFVYVMLVLCVTGLTIAVVRDVAPKINVPVSLLTAYLIITALTTVRPPFAGSRGLAIGAMLVALAVATANFMFGFEFFAIGGKSRAMSVPFFLFGTVALLGSVGDFRVLRYGALQGARRLARHLWRMCFALFIASLSFFIGQAHVFPEPIRIMPLLALPMLTVLATMFYWLWRIRTRPFQPPRRMLLETEGT